MRKKAFWSMLITVAVIIAALTVTLLLFSLPAGADETTVYAQDLKV